MAMKKITPQSPVVGQWAQYRGAWGEIIAIADDGVVTLRDWQGQPTTGVETKYLTALRRDKPEEPPT